VQHLDVKIVVPKSDVHKAILVVFNELDVQKLAEIADKLADINSNSFRRSAR